MDDDFDPEAWLRNRPTLTEDRSHPNHWRNRSADLKASAGAIWYAIKNDKAVADELGYTFGFSMGVACQPVYHMLCGLSLELIMKAVLVQRQEEKNYKHHHLGELHTMLGLPTEKRRMKLLDFYEEALVWSGRYPIPMKPTDQKLESYYKLEVDVLTTATPIVPGSFIHVSRGSGATDWEPFCELYEEYAALFRYPLPTPSPLPPPAPT